MPSGLKEIAFIWWHKTPPDSQLMTIRSRCCRSIYVHQHTPSEHTVKRQYKSNHMSLILSIDWMNRANNNSSAQNSENCKTIFSEVMEFWDKWRNLKRHMPNSSEKQYPNIFYGSQISERNMPHTSQMQNKFLQNKQYYQIFCMECR